MFWFILGDFPGAIDTCLRRLVVFQIADDSQECFGKIVQESDDFAGLGLPLRSDSVLCLLSKKQWY